MGELFKDEYTEQVNTIGQQTNDRTQRDTGSELKQKHIETNKSMM